MGKIVLSNAGILTGEDLELTRGYIEIANGFVKRVAEGSPPGRAIDLKGGFVIPPFVNAHTHVVDAIAKELYLGMEQPEVVDRGGLKFRVLKSRTSSEIAGAIGPTLRDMIGTGTIAHCDFREGGVAGIEILRKSSNPCLKSVILGRPGKIGELPEVLAKGDGIGLPSLNAFSEEELKAVSKKTTRSGKPLAVHAAETVEAQSQSIKATGKTEAERAVELNCSFIVHATHSTEADFSKLRRKGTAVVFCSRANGLLGVGEPPIHLTLEAGTKFFFGTDNAMVCQPNMFAELSFAWASLRRADAKAGGEEARQLLKAATLGPIEILKLPWGPIAEGGRATFTVLSRGDNLAHISDVYSGLVNRARADNIRAIYIDGKAIISKGKN